MKNHEFTVVCGDFNRHADYMKTRAEELGLVEINLERPSTYRLMDRIFTNLPHTKIKKRFSLSSDHEMMLVTLTLPSPTIETN